MNENINFFENQPLIINFRNKINYYFDNIRLSIPKYCFKDLSECLNNIINEFYPDINFDILIKDEDFKTIYSCFKKIDNNRLRYLYSPGQIIQQTQITGLDIYLNIFELPVLKNEFQNLNLYLFFWKNIMLEINLEKKLQFGLTCNEIIKFFEKILYLLKINFNIYFIKDENDVIEITLNDDFLNKLYEDIKNIKDNQINIKKQLENQGKQIKEIDLKLTEILSLYNNFINDLNSNNRNLNKNNLNKILSLSKWLGRNLFLPLAVGLITYQIDKYQIL